MKFTEFLMEADNQKSLTARQKKTIKDAYGDKKVRFKSNGEIHVFGEMPNTNQEGWYFIGYDNDPHIINIIAENYLKEDNQKTLTSDLKKTMKEAGYKAVIIVKKAYGDRVANEIISAHKTKSEADAKMEKSGNTASLWELVSL